MRPAAVRRLIAAAAAFALLGAAPRTTPTQDRLPVLRFTPTHDVLRLVVTGDTGATRTRLLDAMKRIHAQQPIDAIVLLGDNFYPCGVRSTQDPQWDKVTMHFVPLGVPIFPVLGNHDYGEEEECAGSRPAAQVEASAKIAHWLFPARSYEVSTPVADLFLFDSEPVANDWTTSHNGSDPAPQIVAALDHSLAASTAPVRIVGSHHPLYSSGPHGRSGGPHLTTVRAKIGPLLDRYGVTLYMCGHDHILELIGDPAKPPLFLVSGAGSALSDYGPRRGEPPTLFPQPLPKKAFFGFSVVDITRTKVTITMYDEHGDVLAPPFVVPVKRR